METNIKRIIEEKEHPKDIAANGKAIFVATLETIINNPGFQHVAEEIFGNLNDNSLENCQQLNESSKQILEDPLFWLKKFVRGGNLSKKNQKEWTKLIQAKKNTDKEKPILLYLKWTLKKDGVVDLPLYTSLEVQKAFQKKIFCAALNGHSEIVKILAPLTDNPNIPGPIFIASNFEHAEKIAASWNNPNTKFFGDTPIYCAARMGHTEIVKILAPLTDNPNAPNIHGDTPIYWAAWNGHSEIVKILVPLTDIPNAPNENGEQGRYDKVFFVVSRDHPDLW